MLGVRPRSRNRPLLLAVLVGCFGIFFSLTWYSDSAALRMTGAAAQTAPGGALGRGDVRRAIESLIWLGNFYATLAKNDPNRYAAEFWLNMADTYRRAGLALSDLEARGAIRVEDLTGGAASKLEAGAIVLDRRLGGPWQNQFGDATRRGGGDDWSYISQLSTVLLGELFRLQPVAGQNWFKGHRLRSSLTSAAATAENPALTRHLTSFWHLKDKYLWVAMARDDAGSNPPRLRDARKVHLFSEMTMVTKRMERDLGPEWPNRLSSDWREFDRMIDHFSANRGWLAAAPGATTAEAVLGQTITEVAGGLIAKERAPASSAIGGQKAEAAESAAATAPARTETADQPETAVATLTPDPDLEEQISRLTAALESSRQESARLEDSRSVLAAALDKARLSREQLAAELESARQQAATLQQGIETARKSPAAEASVLEAQLTTDLAASRAETTAVEARLSAELETSHTAITALRQEREAERTANQDKTASLEARLTAELEASRAESEAAEERLTTKLETSRTATAALQQELEAERAAGQERVASLESRLAADLEASRTKAAEVEESLIGELEASNATIASLQQELEAARATGQEKKSALVARLTADLEASRAEAAEAEASLTTIASLQQELEAERTASQEKAGVLEARLSADLEASRRETAEVEDHLTTELKTSRAAVASLEQELEAVRAAGQERTSSLEARLTAVLEATRKLAAQQEQRLSEELAASRKSLVTLEKELESEHVAIRQEVARQVVKLGADLEVGEQTAAVLRQQIAAEREAARQKLAGLEIRFDADIKATEQTAAALRQQIEAERAAAEQKFASLEAQLSSGPQKAQRESAALAERLTVALETSKQEMAGLREQLVALKRPAPGLTQDPWIATTTLMLLVILGLAAWIMVLWRERSTVVMADFAAAGVGGVPASLEVGAVEQNGRSTAPDHAELPPLKAPGEAAEEASPQLLVEALRQGDAALFESRFGAMTSLEGERLLEVIYGGVGEELVVACRALGIDKLVFASIFLLSRRYQSGGQEVSPQGLSRAMAAYDATSEGTARDLLKTWQQTAGPPKAAKNGKSGTAGGADPGPPSSSRH